MIKYAFKVTGHPRVGDGPNVTLTVLLKGVLVRGAAMEAAAIFGGVHPLHDIDVVEVGMDVRGVKPLNLTTPEHPDDLRRLRVFAQHPSLEECPRAFWHVVQDCRALRTDQVRLEMGVDLGEGQ